MTILCLIQNSGEIGKKLGELWRELGEEKKRVYEEAAKKAKDRFAREMEAFKEGRGLEEEMDGDGDDFEKLDALLDVTINMDETMLPTTAYKPLTTKDTTTESQDECPASSSTLAEGAGTPSASSIEGADVEEETDAFKKLDEFLDSSLAIHENFSEKPTAPGNDETGTEPATEEEGRIDAFDKLDEFMDTSVKNDLGVQRDPPEQKGDSKSNMSSGDGSSAEKEIDPFEKLNEFLEEEIARKGSSNDGANASKPAPGSMNHSADDDHDFDAFDALDSLL